MEVRCLTLDALVLLFLAGMLTGGGSAIVGCSLAITRWKRGQG